MAGLIVLGFGKQCSRLFIQPGKCFRLFPKLLSTQGAPDEPKRTPSLFLFYYQSIYQDIKKQNPGMHPVHELSKVASSMYKSLSEDDLQKLKERHAKAKAISDEEIKKWKLGLSEDDKKMIEKGKKDKKMKKQKRKIKTLQKENEMPKKPLSGFLQYLTGILKSTHTQYLSATEKMATQKKIFKEASEKWNTLSPEDKKPFLDNAKEEQAFYEERMKEWEDEMIKAGNIKLIRKKTQDKLKQKSDRKERRKNSVVSKKSGVKSSTTTGEKTATTKKMTKDKKTVKFADEHDLSDSDSD